MVPLPHSSSSHSSAYLVSMGALNSFAFRQESFDPKRKRIEGDSPLDGAFNVGERDQLDGKITRMFYSSGLRFNLAENPHYVSAFSFAATHHIPNYVPPGYNALRTKLLEKEKANVEKLLEPAKATWTQQGVTLGEYKDKWFISSLIKEVMVEVGVANVVQIITDNAPVCKTTGLLVEQAHPHVFWTPCVVHTLNLALKSICAAKNTQANEITYDECHWISELSATTMMIKNFITNHSMRLAIFNEFSKLKLLAVAETSFASVIIMLKRFRLIKQQLQSLVISEQWSCYRDDVVTKAKIVEKKLLDDLWWDSIYYIVAFTEPIYDMLRACDTDKSCLHMLLFPSEEARVRVNIELAKFFGCLETFSDLESLRDRWTLDPKRWWLVHGTGAPYLQIISEKLLGHVTSSSCCERNWSTYAFIHSARRNQITPQCAQDLIFMHNNLRLLSRNTPEYMKGDSKLWDVVGDKFEASDDVGILAIANLSLDEPGIESDLLMDEVGEVPRSDHDGSSNMND
ncbi:hypothetical protein BUALT_Bualt14G0046200 [Buddleja alternifolia]|uniref:HAT C-terminal dimerisation domain-containing protein n=1 Tax=Buddleja alternifolia TaxID=168488 RepID=A0AAV6WS00_9LAMI|nr:hypothetical protein BUALT_Bualt14G0046200 [Buddleja alternifolia]